MDQNNVGIDVPGVTTPPTPNYYWESEPEDGEIVGDSSEWEPLPRLNKWVLAEHLNPPNCITPRTTSDHKYAGFQAKYAIWHREYEKMWKHVREMKKIGKDVAGRVTASCVAVKSRELQEMRKAFGLEDAADLARMMYQQKAELSRTSQLRYDDKWAIPGLVDLILRSLPYRAERTTVVAALREFRGRISYAVDYLMPGKGIADLPDFDPGYADFFKDPPTPGKGIDFDFPEDDPFTPWNGIDYDLSEDDLPILAEDALPIPGDDRNAQRDEQLWAYVRDLEQRMDRLQEEVASLKSQLNGALRQRL